MKDFSIKKLVLTIITGIIAIMSFLTLTFALLKMNDAGELELGFLKENGFDFLGFESSYFEKKLYPTITGCVVIFVLVCAVLSILFAVLSIFCKNPADKKLRITTAVLSGISSLAYMIMGIVDKFAFVKDFSALYPKNKEIRKIVKGFIETGSITPFVIIAVLILAYIICGCVLKSSAKDNSGNKGQKISEEKKIDLLLKYNELLKQGIITKEEFAREKSKLLPLEVKKDVKTNDDVKIDQISKYKEMFDNGLITEEEFSEIKKQKLFNV